MTVLEGTAPAAATPAVPNAAQPVVPAAGAAGQADPAKPHVPASALPDDALKARLDHAKATGQTELLRSLGIESPDQLKTIIAAHKATEDAKKSQEQRLAELTATVTSQTAALTIAVQQAVAGMTPEQKAAVDAIAGNDQALWLRTYGALVPTWKAAAALQSAQPAQPGQPAPPAQTPTPATPAPVQPASTSPAPAAPPAAGAVSPTDHKAVWEGMRAHNPIGAAQYLLAHQSQIYPPNK